MNHGLRPASLYTGDMNKLLFCGAILGLISVVMGALGDHAFALTPDQMESMATAIRYNMLYAAVIIGLALTPPERKLHIPGYMFTAGTVLFSFGIYGALLSGISQLTYITPFGGIMIMAGWGGLALKALWHHRTS